MNIKEGRRADVWTMMKQFLSQNPSWWKRLIEVAKCQAEKSIVFYSPKNALSDRDIIEDWVKEMWKSNYVELIMLSQFIHIPTRK